MKQERLKALSKATTQLEVNEHHTGPEMQQIDQVAADGLHYRIESFQYDLQNETEAFHALFQKWAVGSVDYVYYIPDFVTEEEEAELLSKVRQCYKCQKVLGTNANISCPYSSDQQPANRTVDSVETSQTSELGYVPLRDTQSLSLIDRYCF